jgi:hypothetical protein
MLLHIEPGQLSELRRNAIVAAMVIGVIGVIMIGAGGPRQMITALAFLGVCVVGHFVVAPCMYGMRWLALSKKYLEKQETKFLGDCSVFLIGATERYVALTLVLLAPLYLPAFIGGWVLLKFALGWQRVKENGEAMTDSMLAIIGNVLSFAIAIGVGVYLNPDAIDVWAKPH